VEHGQFASRIAKVVGVALTALVPAFADWEPSKTVELVVPAGRGGGADRMARVIQAIIAQHGLMKQPMVVVNEGGGAGAEGFLDVKKSRGDPHKIIITLSNVFTTPLGTGVPFSWKELTPVRMMALDQFVLWVNAETPYKTAKDYLAAATAAGPKKFKMGGAGSKQEDEILTAAIERRTGARFTYVPFKGSAQVAAKLVEGQIDSSLNNPIEGAPQWRAGRLRPLCVFDNQRMPYRAKVARDAAWSDVPTCKEAGLDTHLLMLHGIFMPGGVPREAVDYYADVLDKVTRTPEWKKFIEEGAFNTTALKGNEYSDWLAKNEQAHESLMKEAGFLARK
jgi:tripartite-type tricarboxylate transporter receptor subunit TctC